MIERLRHHPWVKYWPLILAPLSLLLGEWIYLTFLHAHLAHSLGQTLWFTAHYSAPCLLALLMEIYHRRFGFIPHKTRQLLWGIALVVILIPAYDHLRQIGAFDGHKGGLIDVPALARFNRVLLAQILLTALVSGLFLFLLALPVPDSRKAKRSRYGELGDARFMNLREARQQFSEGGICLGEAYRPDQDKDLQNIKFDPAQKHTWGQGGRKPLLRSAARDASGHGLVFVGSGGFKTTGFAVPTALEWDGPLICFDPSLEIGPLVHAARKRKGYRVISLNPKYAATNNFNALEWILNSPDDMEENVGVISSWIIGPTAHLGGTGKYFAESADNLIRAILADLLFDDNVPPEDKTLAELRRSIAQSSEDLRRFLETIALSSDSPLARSMASTLYDLAPDQFSGIVGQAQTATAFLDIAKFGALVSGTSFSLDELVKGETDIFINVPLESLLATPAIGKIIMAAFLNGIMKADGRYSKRVMVLVDEAFQLGKGFQPLLKARDVGRKYGISLALLYQSVGQLVDNYGEEGRQAFFESAAYRIYSAVQDHKTAQSLSDECGNYTGYVRNAASSSRNGLFGLLGPENHSVSRSITKVPLITADEILQMRRDEALIFSVGNRPLRCSRPIYFRRRDMVQRTGKRRF
ncbi:type IV secretory system conjugative DNA transfer family protein [Paremcibacter congregatus]|uniref:Ti-type conjugative transfer system protein TraG n=1 Tax=Paremcibacter congregatus TaxID=2043170 RepID=A0A2G4YWR9_9PROT|nr:type IV secretory system conjugative DNA transfer family protein [Paremcibacter congregatus]PHZ86759.1 Ti-type conjugative transfer system protein TraG [Paremcibacter congregatus]